MYRYPLIATFWPEEVQRGLRWRLWCQHGKGNSGDLDGWSVISWGQLVTLIRWSKHLSWWFFLHYWCETHNTYIHTYIHFYMYYKARHTYTRKHSTELCVFSWWRIHRVVLEIHFQHQLEMLLKFNLCCILYILVLIICLWRWRLFKDTSCNRIHYCIEETCGRCFD